MTIGPVRNLGLVEIPEYQRPIRTQAWPSALKFSALVDGVEQFILLPVEPGSIVNEQDAIEHVTLGFKHFDIDHGGCRACTT